MNFMEEKNIKINAQGVRDLYNDDIRDVYTINDLDQLKNEGLINVLAKEDNYLMFEAGKDFWKLDLDKGELVQYNDFISLENNTNGRIVYGNINPEKNEDYGAVLFDTIIESEALNLPNFSLQKRQDYLENTTKNVVKQNVSKEFERSLEKNKRKSKEVSKDLLEPLNKQETKMLVDMMDVAIESLALFYTIFNAKNKQHKKEALIKDILKKLDNKEINVKDILRNKSLNQEIPELKEILEEWAKGVQRIDVKTSVTVDDLLDKAPTEKDENIIVGQKKPLLIGEGSSTRREEIISDILDNSKVNEVANKLSESKTFHLLRAEEFCEKMDREMEIEYGKNFSDTIKTAFEKSGEKDPTDFFAKILSDQAEEINLRFPNVSPKESGLSMVYMNSLVEDKGKEHVSEKMLEKMGGDGNFSLGSSNILSLVKIIADKIHKELNQEKIKTINFK